MVIGIDCSRAFVSEKTGTENYSYQVIKHLLRVPDAKQHKFVLFTRPNAIIPDWIVQKNVRIHPIQLRYLWTQVGLAAQTWGIPLDVLWISAHTLPVWRKPGLKTVVTIHGLEYQWLKEYNNWLQKWYLPLSTIYATQNATKLIAVSNFTKKQLVEQLHTDKKKIKVIHEGVNFAQITNPKFSNAQMDKDLDKFGIVNKKYILFVGTIQPRKNLVSLIEAFSILMNNPDLPADRMGYKLVIAGSAGWSAGDILRAPSRWGVQDRVVFTGRVSEQELESLYLGARVYVQPSVTEGFGLPVLEAMAMGVPVISSDGGALREVVGDAGRVVELGANFVNSLVKAIERVIDDKKLQNTLISMGHERVKEFSWDSTAKQTLDEIVG